MLQAIRKSILATAPVKEVVSYLIDKKTLHFKQFSGSSALFLLDEIHKQSGTILHITKDFERAAAVASDFEQLGTEHVHLFPPTRRKPYDDEKVLDMSIMVQRSEVLEKISEKFPSIIVASADALLEKLVPSDIFHQASIHLNKGEVISPEELSAKLTDQGYQSTRFVDAPGEFALRGGIFDVFPFSGEYPVRIEFFGDEIDSIREFDPDSQRSVAFLNEARLVPNATFTENGQKESLFSYLPENTILSIEDPEVTKSEIQTFFEKAIQVYSDKNSTDIQKPDAIFLTPDEWDLSLKKNGVIFHGSFSNSEKIDHQITLSTPSFF